MISIIFGVNGQDGYYLHRILELNHHQVIGVSRSVKDGIKGDVSNYQFVTDIIKLYKPDYIFHLAANSTTQHHALFENHETISTGTLNILEAVRLHCPAAKVFLSGSAMQFKNEGLPINEQTPFEAKSPYSISRIQSVYAGRYYRNMFGLKVYVGYFFNHDSPFRGENHVNQKIVKAVQRIAQGSDELLVLGNIDVKKEFNFAGDCMEAVWTLVNQNALFEAVIGSGKAYSIKDWLIGCFDKIGKNWLDFVQIKQDFVPEYQVLVCSPQLINSLGWQPKVDFLQLIDLMITSK
ncbi:MAG: GDP-mannose 4,6-dehydratase [Mucilaginibacter sp.]